MDTSAFVVCINLLLNSTLDFATALKMGQREVKVLEVLYVARDMLAGEVFAPENLRIVRPGYSEPKYYELFLWKRISGTREATPVCWDLLR